MIFTKDTHTADYLYTQEGKRLPVLHGQEGTEGYKIHPDIVKAVQEHYAPDQILTVKKPTFGSLDFGNTLKAIWEEVTAAGEAAEGEYPMEVDFTGFCTGICVLSNVVMAKAFVCLLYTSGKSQIAYAVARILKLPWTTLDMSSINDPEQLTGSSRIYANAKPGIICLLYTSAKN